MSTGNTETRILQMQLENKDFEEGVRQTIKSLENLEEKLNLKNAGDGFEKVSAAANSVQMSHLESGLDSVTNKFTLMGQIGLQVLERISSQVVNTGEKILRAATIQPMIDGWGEFEMKTNSVQTILGGIRHQFDDQPTAINAISDALDDLNQYADKTIYNFAQMTENVGKFTNQGIKLEESTNAIKGIANWAAAVGANPAQMSRAMYNISQSLGAGSMQLIDWRSIRFANMATPEVKELFVEVAKTMGMLDENGQVRHGQQVFDALNDFEASLKGKWLTNEVMAEAFSIYANAFSETELIEKYGETIGKKFYEMGVYAEEAATKVRTFSQLIGVLKESLGSGWANTFDILLGGFEKQTEFLTAIKNRIEEIINFQTEDRNTWLQNFSDIGGIQVFQDAILTTLDILSDFYWVFNDVTALILNPFGSSVFNMTDGIFGPRQEGYTELRDTWKGVKGVFDDLSNTLQNFRKWLYTPGEKSGRSPIHNLANALSGVAGAAGIAWQVLTGFGKFVFRIFKRFEPLVSSVLDLLGQIGGAIYNVFFNLTGQQSIEKVFDKIGDAIEPVIDFVVGLATAVVDLIHSFLGIDAAADDWTVLGERMKAFWEIFRYDPDLSFVDNFTNSLKKALTAVFGEDTANSIIKAWDDNVAPVLEQISGFFTDAFADLNRVLEGLRTAAAADYSQATGVKGGIGTFLTHFLKGYFGDDTQGAEKAYTDILEIYHQLEGYYTQYVKPFIQPLTKVFTETLPNLNKKIIDFLFGKEMWVANEDTEFITKERRDGLISKIKEFFASEEWEKISKAADAAIGWVKKAFDTAFDFLFGKQYDAGDGSKFRFGGMIQDIPEYFNSEEWAKTIKSVEEFFDPVIKAFDEAYKKIYAFLFGNEVIGKRGNTWREGGLFEYFTSETWQENWKLIQEGFETVKKWIEDKGTAAWNTIMTFLFGPETEGKEGKKERSGGIYQEAIKFLTPVWEWISSTGEKLYNYVTTHNFQQMWQKLNDLLFGYNEWVYNDQEMGQKVPHDGVLTPIVEMLQPIADVFNKVKGWALEKIGNIDWAGIWASISGFFTGYDEWVYNDQEMGTKVHHDSVFERIANFFDQIIAYFQSPEFQEFWTTVTTFYHEHIEPALNWMGGLGSSILGAIGGIFSGKGFSGFESVGTYLTDGINTLLNKISPGLSLDGLFGGLFGGGSGSSSQTPKTDSGKDATNNGSGGVLDWLVDLFTSDANAAEADEAQITDASASIVATLGDTEKSAGAAIDAQAKTSETIFDKLVKFLPIIGGGIALSKVSDIVIGITGNKKATLLEQLTGIFGSLGELFKGLGIVIGAAAIAEKISPGALDKAFNRIESLLSRVFVWIAAFAVGGKIFDVGGYFLGELGTKKLFGGEGSSTDPGKVMENSNFGSIAETISSVGVGLQGIFDALQTMYNLALEIAAADFVFGVDDKGANNFDKKFDRVMGFISKIMLVVLESEGLATLSNTVNTWMTGLAEKVLDRDIDTGETISKMLIGIGSLVDGIGDGVSKILTASAVPALLNADLDKVSQVIDTVVKGIGLLIAAVDLTTLLSKLGPNAGKDAAKTAAITGAGLGAGISALVGLVGSVAIALFNWFSTSVTEKMKRAAPALYSFASSLEKTLTALSNIKETLATKASSLVTDDLPVLFQAITAGDIGFDKDVINERGNTIRDFGTNIYSGVNALVKAKDAFDKYNTGGEESFPLAFFKAMTEALEYMNTGEIKEMYNQFFTDVFGDLVPTSEQDLGIAGVSSFFDTLNKIGYVVTESSWKDLVHEETNQQLVSTKEGFGDFQTAFAGIQATFRSLVEDISSDGFSIEKLNSVGDLIKKIVEAGNDFVNAYVTESKVLDDGTIARKFAEYSPISNLSFWLNQIGSGLRDLDNQLRTDGQYDIDYTQIENALKALEPLAELDARLQGYKTIYNSDGKKTSVPIFSWLFGNGINPNEAGSTTALWISKVMGYMEELGKSLHTLATEIKNDDLKKLEATSGILSSLSVLMGLDDPFASVRSWSIQEIGEYASAFTNLKQSLIVTEAEKGSSIASMIQEVMNAAGGKPVQVKITPILDDNTNLPEGMSMENNYGRTITMAMNMNDVVNVRVDATQISSLVTANNQTRDKIDSLASAIRGIRVQVNNVIGPNALRSGRSVQTYPLVANYQNPYEIP